MGLICRIYPTCAHRMYVQDGSAGAPNGATESDALARTADRLALDGNEHADGGDDDVARGASSGISGFGEVGAAADGAAPADGETADGAESALDALAGLDLSGGAATAPDDDFVDAQDPMEMPQPAAASAAPGAAVSDAAAAELAAAAPDVDAAASGNGPDLDLEGAEDHEYDEEEVCTTQSCSRQAICESVLF